MKSSAKLFVALAVVANLVIVGVILRQHRAGGHSEAEWALKSAAPEIYDRLKHQVARLEDESMAESLANLADVELFYWPGPDRGPGSFGVRDLPLSSTVGTKDVEAICSNRRFCKLFEEAEELDKVTFSKRLNDEFIRCTAEYLKLYDAKLQEQAPSYNAEKLKDQKTIVGPGFVTGNVKNGEIVLAGSRLKILALVSICGALQLAECKTNVASIVRIALKQREDMYSDASLHSFFRSEMLKQASLYNRQIIGSALLGLESEEVQAEIVKDLGLEWKEYRIPSFKVTLTEFDLPVKSGAMQPDYTLGSRSLKILRPLEDSTFDQLLKKCTVR